MFSPKKEESCIPHRNNEIDKAILDQTKLDNYSVAQMRKMMEKIQLIVDVSPFTNQEIQVASLADGMGGQIFKCSASVDTYLLVVYLSASEIQIGSTLKDVYISFTDAKTNTVQKIGMALPVPAAGSNIESVSVNFPFRGIKLARNSTIDLTSSVDAAYSLVAFYEVDPAISSLHEA